MESTEVVSGFLGLQLVWQAGDICVRVSVRSIPGGRIAGPQEAMWLPSVVVKNMDGLGSNPAV